MFDKLSDAEIREHCRSRLESLELWLRRVIDDTLTSVYGSSYFDYVDESGNRIIKKRVVDNLDNRKIAEPSRYPRRIDAILLDDAISIVCNQNLFTKHFHLALSNAFPGGADSIRQMLERITDVRNRLAHANPISIKDATRVECYSSDVIDSLRSYFQDVGMNNEYNVPTILRLSDSFGNRLYRNQLGSVHDGGILYDISVKRDFWLRPGDTYSIEVEVDPAFDPATYNIFWASTKVTSVTGSEPKIVVPINTEWVGGSVGLQCYITSNKSWHRMGLGADDFLIVNFRVLPPLD